MTTRPYHEPYRGLPRELREQIYQYLFRTDGVIRICTDGLPGYSNAPYTHRTDENFVHTTGAPTYRSKIPFAVFLTNKAMSSEALAVLYSKSTFEFTEIHPYAVTTFFLRLRKEHRLMIKHVSFHAWLYYPKWDSLRTMNREPITAEKYIGQMSSMLRYLVREIKLDTLAVVSLRMPKRSPNQQWSHLSTRPNFYQESEPLSYERDGQGVALQTQFHGHPLLQLTNARILREALLEGDLRVLKWRYDYSLVDFYRVCDNINDIPQLSLPIYPLSVK